MKDVDSTEQHIISIATGIGGLERGLERAGVNTKVVAYVEIEAFIIANLVAAMETGNMAAAPIWTDVKTFPYRSFYKRIHGITAGYPCQPFSVAGSRKGTNDPRHLWPFIYRIVQTVKPFWCFFENVAGHLNLRFDEVSRDLRRMGYKVEAGIFSAAEVGATHQRKRLFILASLGHTKYNGFTAKQKLRSNETTSHTWIKKEQETPIKSEGANRSRNVRSIQRSQERGKQLDNTRGNGLKQEHQIQTRRHSPELTSEGMANTIHNDEPTTTGKLQSKAGKIEKAPWEQDGQRVWNESRDGSETLADTSGKGFERQQQSGTPEEGIKQQKPPRPITKCHIDQWPARPGEPQHEWEEPRAVESSMGITVDGYNFREDLLRAAGNGVVEQTAAKAWLELNAKLNNK